MDAGFFVDDIFVFFVVFWKPDSKDVVGIIFVLFAAFWDDGSQGVVKTIFIFGIHFCLCPILCYFVSVSVCR